MIFFSKTGIADTQTADALLCLMPPIFGLIANYITVALLPLYLLLFILLMCIMHERLNRIA